MGSMDGVIATGLQPTRSAEIGDAQMGRAVMLALLDCVIAIVFPAFLTRF